MLPITLPFTVASSRKPAAVQALAGHRVAELCVAITRARAAVGKPKIPRQAPAAALTIDVLAAGALPRHLVAQRAHRALRVALACWKTPREKLHRQHVPTNTPITDTAQRQDKQWGWQICYMWK